MTTKEANSKARKLFNQWRKEFCNYSEEPTDEYYTRLKQFKADCKALHDVVGVYGSLTDRNALKMASICSSVRFVEPYLMLMQLQKTTKSY
jgi:hypothetical protein